MIINQQHRYSVFKHEPLINNQSYFINDIKTGRQFLKEELKTDELTWIYQKYNIFGILAGSHYYWNLFKDIGVCIKKHILDNLKQETLPKNMWIQAWLNWHTKDQLLKKHHHADDGKGFMHGFISIEPQNTKTIFYERYEDKEPIYHINNEVGNIYIGDGNKWHEVVSDNGFSGDRITIGFDVMTRNSATKNFGFIPIIY